MRKILSNGHFCQNNIVELFRFYQKLKYDTFFDDWKILIADLTSKKLGLLSGSRPNTQKRDSKA